MKIVSIIAAIVVSLCLYLLVFERDRLLSFAGRGDATEAASEETATDTADIEGAVEQDTSENAQIVKVVAMSSQAEQIESAVILRGRTEAARQVVVAAETLGQMISEPLRKGTFVNEGDMLCQLDPGTRQALLAEARARLTEAQGRVPEAEAAMLEAQARVTEAEVNVNVARRGVEDGFSTESRLVSAQAVQEAAVAGLQRVKSQISSAQAGIESAEAAVASAEREIERLTIEAPFSGLLETDTAELGSLLQAGSPCATVIQLDPIKLVGFVPEADVDKIDLGALAGAELTNGEQVRGRVTFLSRSADDTTRTFRVEVEVPNPDLAVRDGQTVEIIVAAEGRTAHLVPQSALTLDDNGAIGVRTIAEGNTALFMPITIVRDTPQGIWVTDLPEAVDIITIGQEFVIDGVTVDPTYSEAEG